MALCVAFLGLDRLKLIWVSRMLSTRICILRLKNTSVGAGLLILSLAWLVGCSGDSVKSAWQQPGPRPPPFSRILIVGISTDFTQRCSFEYSLASQFQGSSTTPIASCDTLMPKDALTRANIERVVAATHADAVLTSTVVTVQMGSEQGNTRDTRGTSYYQVTGVGWVTGDLGAYGVPVAFVQLDTTKPIPQITGSVHILTKLFDVNDAKLLYTLDSETKSDDVQSSSSAIETITGEIGAKLHRDGIIH
jgi:hypothetical protein